MKVSNATDEYKAFVARARRAVERRGISHSRIAANCGWTPWQLSARLCLRQRVTVEDVPKLCAALGIKAGVLFGE